MHQVRACCVLVSGNNAAKAPHFFVTFLNHPFMQCFSNSGARPPGIIIQSGVPYRTIISQIIDSKLMHFKSFLLQCYIFLFEIRVFFFLFSFLFSLMLTGSRCSAAVHLQQLYRLIKLFTVVAESGRARKIFLLWVGIAENN